MRHRKPLLWPLALAFVLGTAACSDTGVTDPSAEFDADETSADFQAMNDVFQSGIWESFGVLGELFPIGSTSAQMAFAVQATGELATSRSMAATEQYVGDMALSLAARVPKIPFEVRGITFVLDPETLRYVPSDRPGAPETGVRFILYAVNPVTKKPMPDVEIGYADLIDLGDELENGVSLRFIVVSGDVTYFDYTVTAVHTDTAGELDVEGFIGNGETVIEFAINVGATRSETSRVMEVAFDIGIPARSFGATGTIRHEQNGDQVSHAVNMEITVGDKVIGYSAERTREEVNAEITVNGELFATITGHPEHPVIAGPGGRDLTERELRAVRHIHELTEHVFRMIEHLLRPGERILRLDLFHRGR